MNIDFYKGAAHLRGQKGKVTKRPDVGRATDHQILRPHAKDGAGKQATRRLLGKERPFCTFWENDLQRSPWMKLKPIHGA